MNELKRVREQALLTDEEILEALEKAPFPCPMQFKDEPKIRAVVQAQLDKALKDEGILVKCDVQSLPKPYPHFLSSNTLDDKVLKAQYEKAQQDMLKPDSEGNHWVKVRPKEDNES